jgi:hypothetical protein
MTVKSVSYPMQQKCLFFPANLWLAMAGADVALKICSIIFAFNSYSCYDERVSLFCKQVTVIRNFHNFQLFGQHLPKCFCTICT